MNRADGELYSLEIFPPEGETAPAPPDLERAHHVHRFVDEHPPVDEHLDRQPVPERRATVAKFLLAVIAIMVAAFAGYWAVRRPSPPATPSQTNHSAPAADPTGRNTIGGEHPQNAEPDNQISAASTASPDTREAAPSVSEPGGSATPLPLAVDEATFSPSFATTGDALFFHAGRTTSGRLLEADLDGEGKPLRVITVLADSARNYHLRVSPNQQLVAFDSDRDGERGVYIARRDGSGPKRVSDSGFAALPSWSPDMKWLAFVRAERGRPRVWNLWLRHVDTGALARVTSYPFGQVWGASWFSDDRLCYSHEDRLVILDLASRKTDVFRTPRAGHLVRTPAVSPDGQRIVFQVFRDGAWMLDVGTRQMTRVLDDPTAEEFAWDPQGSRIAYHSRKSGAWRIWVATLRLS